jgi:uncharacterized protein YndB with AHSA1/START domain
MAAESPVTLRVSRRFTAPPERVFDAWLDPNVAGKWLFATPTGRMVRVEIDARVGGKFVLVDQRNGEDVEHCGEYHEIDRPRRLVFTFGVPKYSPVVTRVTIDIAPTDGGCELTLTHDGVPPEWASQTESGWTKLLESLGQTLGQGKRPTNHISKAV